MKATVMIALLALSANNALAEAWLCVADQSVGFAFQSGEWRHVFLNPSDKYVLRSIRDSDKGSLALAFEPKATHVFSKIGEKWLTPCIDYHVPNGSSAGFITCRGLDTFALFNRDSLRFETFYSFGYVIDDPDSKDGLEIQRKHTPSLTIGKCSSI